MRYAIPTEKPMQEKDYIRLLRTATGQQARSMDQALRLILELANQDQENKIGEDPLSESYEKLYSVYELLGLTENKRADELFPQDSRSEKNLKEELNNLWCVLQLQPLEKDKNLPDTYRKWKSDPEKYRSQLKQKDEEERQNAQLDKEQDREILPLVDKESPYYEFVSGTVYEELFQLWNTVKDHLDYKQKTAQILKQDMEQLLSDMQLHYIRRNSSGSCLPMTDKEYKELSNLYGECVKDVTRLWEKDQNILEYDSLCSLLVQNNNQLKGVSSGNLPPLANVIHGLKTPVIRLQNTNSDPVGAAMSNREAVEYTDENGGLHQGFFTAELAETGEMTDARKIFERYIEQHPRYNEPLRKIFGSLNMREEFNAFRLAAFDFKKKKMDAVDQYIDRSNGIKQEYKENENFRAVLKELAVDVEKNRNRHTVLRLSGINPGDEISKRSAAMSDVARMLGFPDLLANSSRVTVKREGKEVAGVMMETAGPNAADPAYLTGTDPFYKVDPKEFNSKAMLSSLADLQILDYLCANTDRHANNFFFQQDFSDPEHPKLLGVKGIDNDNSFGALKEGGVMRLARPDNLKIITEKMAAAVETMTSQELEELLKPYHFREEQVAAASKRLAQLQEMIQKGREKDELKFRNRKLINENGSIHIVKEDEWNQLKLTSLVPLPEEKDKDPITNLPIMEIPSNIFYMAADHLFDVKNAKKGEPVGEANKDKAPIRYSKQEFKIDFEKILQLQNEEYKKLKGIKKRLDDNGAKELGDRSKKFRSMYRAFQKYAREYEKMRQILSDTEDKRIHPEPVKEKKDLQTREEKLTACYRNLETARQNLNHEIERYRNKSHVFKIKEDNQARIDAATDLQKLLQGKTESERFFENSAAPQERHKADLRQKNDFQLAGYIGNQIYGKMKVTLQSNLKTLRPDDPVHVLGVKALEAQERLWNYAQSSLETGLISVKISEERQRVSVEQLQKAIGKKANDKIDMERVRTDMEMIRLYAQELEKKGNKAAAELKNQIEGILNPKEKALKEKVSGEKASGEKNEISGRAVKAVLNKMYQGELQTAKERSKEKNMDPVIHPQDLGKA